VRGEGAERGMLSGKFLGPMWGAFAMLILAPPLIAASSLPVVEVAATGGQSDTLAVMVSGDGGWAPIDRSIASVLAQNGIPVAGLNALQYFWKRRTPDEAARDLQQIVETHLAAWGKRRIVFIGYSRGADVLPAMTKTPVTALRDAIDHGDKHEFEHAFDELSAACTACHRAAGNDFLVIQRPTTPLLDNLRVAPAAPAKAERPGSKD